MEYTFKWKPELLLGVLGAVVMVVIQVAAETDLNAWIDDWESASLTIAAAAYRAFFGALVAAGSRMVAGSVTILRLFR